MPKKGPENKPARRELNLATRAEIVTYHQTGLSTRAIARKVKLSLSTVDRVIQRWKTRGSLENKQRSGRPPKVTQEMRKHIDRFISQHDEAVPKEIQQKLHLPVSPRTIFNVRKSLGYRGTQGKRELFFQKKTRKIE